MTQRSFVRTAVLFVAVLLSVGSTAARMTAQVPFQRVEISVNAGDVKLVGDLDLDGTADVILGGSRGEDLNWYHYPDWTRTRIAVPTVEFTTDGDIGDLDGDGDLDLVVPDGSGTNNLVWFRNPTIDAGGAPGNPFSSSAWQRFVIGSMGSWCKDVEIADYDGDGEVDVAARSNTVLRVFFQAGGAWTSVDMVTSALGREGLATGDLDRDGNLDFVVRGRWLRNPGSTSARMPAAWSEHVIDPSRVDVDFKACVADIDGDQFPDVLFSSSENTADIAWYRHGGDPTATWSRHVIEANVNRAHTLQVADVDSDGDADVVSGRMHTSTSPGVRIHFNQNGLGTAWAIQVVDQQFGIHNGVVADLGGDGDVEIVGSNWTGNPPLQFWENRTPQSDHVLSVPDLVAGSTHALFVTHATPQSPVALCLTARGVTTPYPVPGLGVQFALLDPLLLGVAVAGANGAASFEMALPPGLAGLTIWLQSLELGRTSPAESRTIR
ncbi:MAG: FG-GAP repeat domain-containing protein [Planctomycetota bacterium]